MAAARSISRLSNMLQGWQKNVASKIQGSLKSAGATKQAAAEFKPPVVNEYGETDAKPSWARITVTAAFLGYLSMNAVPIIAEGTIRHPVLLLKVKDPFFQRAGASRLVYFTVTDERRQRAVEYGAIHLLMDMLEGARDDKTRIAALKAMDALGQCELAVKMLDELHGPAALEKLAGSSTNKEILTLITSVKDKIRGKSRVDETEELPLGAPTLAI